MRPGALVALVLTLVLISASIHGHGPALPLLLLARLWRWGHRARIPA